MFRYLNITEASLLNLNVIKKQAKLYSLKSIFEENMHKINLQH